MAMSENEAIKFIGQAIIQSGEALEKLQSIKSEAERIGKIGEYYANLDNCVKEIEACRVAMNALSEIQQYREIGTVEELKSLKENGAFTGVELAQLVAMQMRLKDYQSIGTVEECRTAVERMKPKKIMARKKARSYLGTDYYCPTCNKRQLTAYAISKGDDCCKDCGQKLDWE